MGGPVWLRWALAAVMVGIAACCLARMAYAGLRRRPNQWGVDVTHTAMSVGMVGMYLPALAVGPAPVWTGIFAAATAGFAAAAVRAAGSGVRLREHLGHAAGCVAMTYMVLVMAGVLVVGGGALSATPGTAGGADATGMAAMPGMAGMEGMAGMAGAGGVASSQAVWRLAGVAVWPVPVPVAVAVAVTVVLAVVTFAVAVRQGIELLVPLAGERGCGCADRRTSTVAPRFFHGCHAVMGVAMSAMLLVML